MSKPDQKWFEDRIRATTHGSIRGLARHMRNARGDRMDHSALARILRGERELAAKEAVQLASLLGCSVDEILFRMGIVPRKP